MPLSLEEIKFFINEPQNKELLERACDIRRKHELHVCGIGLDDYIDKIQGVENKSAVSLRRSLGKVITQPELNKIIAVENKIFSARGGGRFYDFSNDTDQEIFKSKTLQNVKSGMPIKTYMQKVWKELVNIDPMGLIMAEINQEAEIYLTYKSSESLYDIGFDSATDIQYIIFKPSQNKEKDAQIYRIIDDSADYLVMQKGKEISIIENEFYINPWQFVPACFISDRMDKKSNGFTSHIEEALIYADDMLLDYTIAKIYKVRLGIPYHWQYKFQCPTCEGSGHMIIDDKEQSCSACEGTGNSNKSRDIAEILILPIPEEGDIPLAPPAGYVQMDLQYLTNINQIIDSEAIKMYNSIWGSLASVEIDRRNVTATELGVRETSKEYKLNEISDNEENVEKFITDIFGKFHFPGSYQGAIVNNGRNYDLKTADELLNDYQEGIKNNLPTTELTEILENYYHSIYNRNPKKLNEAIIKLKVKPFFHWQPEKLQAANVNQIDYLKNLYFDEFYVWFEQNKGDMGFSTIEIVQAELDKWIIQKIPEQTININNENVETNGRI